MFIAVFRITNKANHSLMINLFNKEQQSLFLPEAILLYLKDLYSVLSGFWCLAVVLLQHFLGPFTYQQVFK